MRLERLEISGFKSFSDRSELSFDEGVTAIVGPNGCGKSNLADALTWVLGEQSARSLRGDRMEDVIFSGSDARKPTGAAEVRLKLSGVVVPPSLVKEMGGYAGPRRGGNGHAGPAPGGEAGGNGHGPERLVRSAPDGDAPITRDVELTRRLFRSGESEYLIDGHQCRLRDIHELLMDTGLGAKAYAIIEQGKIGMILSSRPTDRRQLIEEAAGITKYKARRRAAELKLEAAQQNLTRLDDIIFEVETQRGGLKRQAATARRFSRLRDEMRRWEKVLLARRYRVLAESIDASRARLADARVADAAAAARLAEVDAELARLRLAQSEADAAAASLRERAHACELAINQRNQHIALARQQAEMLAARAAELEQERADLEARREPERLTLEARRLAAVAAGQQRDEAGGAARAAAEEHARAQQAIEIAEQEVEHRRAGIYAVVNTVTALTAAADSAAVQRERAVDTERRLDVETRDLAIEIERVEREQQTAAAEAHRLREVLGAAQAARAARGLEIAAAREEHEQRLRAVRAREQDLAATLARLRSLEELDAHRAGFGDAARLVLANADDSVAQMGALADYLEVDATYERAVEACLGDLLQHVLVERLEHAAAGLRLIRQHGVGRAGFIVTGAGSTDVQTTGGPTTDARMTGVSDEAVPLSSVVTIVGPFGAALRAAMGNAFITDSIETAARLASGVPVPVATLDGDVCRGGRVVTGGGKAEARGILATKREIKQLRERAAGERTLLARLAEDLAGVERRLTEAAAALEELNAEIHRHEKAIVSVDAQLDRTAQDERRLRQRADLVASETRRVREEIADLDQRQAEAGEAIARLGGDRQMADAALLAAQQRLAAARSHAEACSRTAAEARAAHAGLVERSAAAAVEAERLEADAVELERRVEACSRDLAALRDQRCQILASVAENHRELDAGVRTLDALRDEVRAADERAGELRAAVDRQDEAMRDARRAVDAIRAAAAELDVTRATAEAELAHLAQQALDTVGAPLDAVRDEVTRIEAAGEREPDVDRIRAAEEVEPGEETPAEDPAATLQPARVTAEEAIAELRSKIDRIGPINMMAIEQHRELDERHTFLTTQRRDLVDSIAQTNEAIRRIDETTDARFREAFAAIDANFQETFATLFGGGRAGIRLLDESDPLESGIDIVASPPGKRLQNVMLLSGGEKALAAIALMFAIFRYKPSPFCLLDEIDAPLDDANIGRFVELLRGMMDRTQFIIITHSRKTMEIADRLYGVTMEEPGVSKLISIQMN